MLTETTVKRKTGKGLKERTGKLASEPGRDRGNACAETVMPVKRISSGWTREAESLGEREETARKQEREREKKTRRVTTGNVHNGKQRTREKKNIITQVKTIKFKERYLQRARARPQTELIG